MITNQFLIKNTMADMQSLSSDEIQALKTGTYDGVELLGYYRSGDTPVPIYYRLNANAGNDDGFSVIHTGDIKLEHDFREVVNLAYLGDFDTTTDIGNSLAKIAAKYLHSIVEINDNTTLFLDCTVTRTIGQGYSGTMIIRGKGASSRINIPSYTGVAGAISNWWLRLSLENVYFDGMTDTVSTYSKALSSYLVVDGFIRGCRFDNFNGSIQLMMRGSTEVHDNFFGKFTDHTLYFRNNVVSDNKQDILNIYNNTFQGANSIKDFYGESTSNPRECIKLAGQLEECNIYNNTFKGWGVNVLISVGGEAGDGQPVKKTINKFSFYNNTSYTGYASINYAGLIESTFDFSSSHTISNNIFDSNTNLNYGNKDFVFTAHINAASQSVGYVKLKISDNIFINNNNYAVQLNSLTNNLMQHEIDIDINTFNKSRLYLRNIKRANIKSNIFKGNDSLTLACINSPTFEVMTIKGNSVQNVGLFLLHNSGASTPVAYIGSNCFDHVDRVFQSSSYGLSHIWVGNQFRSCAEWIGNGGTTSTSNNGFRSINNIFESSPFSLDPGINLALARVNLSPSEINGIKVLGSAMLGKDGRKNGAVYIDQASGEIYYYLSNTWKSINPLANTSVVGLVKQAAISADSAPIPSVAYTQTEVEAILAELRDLKAKLRTAGVLAV